MTPRRRQSHAAWALLSGPVLLAACADRAPSRTIAAAPVASDVRATDGDAGPHEGAKEPHPKLDEDAGRPAVRPPRVLDVSYVNLSVWHGGLGIDRDRNGLFTSTRDQLFPGDTEGSEVVEGTASEAAMSRLVEVLKRSRFCSIKPPSDEPMVWTAIRVDFEDVKDMKCTVRMSPAAWRKRHPEIVRAVHAIEHDVCSGGCPRSPSFD